MHVEVALRVHALCVAGLSTGVCDGASTSWGRLTTYKYSKGEANEIGKGACGFFFRPNHARNQENNASGVAGVKWGGYCISMATIIIKSVVSVLLSLLPLCLVVSMP